MGILTTIVTVLFVIVCLLLILMILLQADKSGGMGLIGTSSQSTFGSSTADVVTKITAVLVGLFLVLALVLAGLNTYAKSSAKKELLGTATEAPSGEVKSEEPAAEQEKADEPAAEEPSGDK